MNFERSRNSGLSDALETRRVYRKINKNLLKSNEEETFCKEFSRNSKKILITIAFFAIFLLLVISFSIVQFSSIPHCNQVKGYVRDKDVFYISDQKNTVSLQELNLEKENLQNNDEIVIYLDDANNIVKSYSVKSHQNGMLTMLVMTIGLSIFLWIILTYLFINENRIRNKYYETVIKPCIEKEDR